MTTKPKAKKKAEDAVTRRTKFILGLAGKKPKGKTKSAVTGKYTKAKGANPKETYVEGRDTIKSDIHKILTTKGINSLQKLRRISILIYSQ